MISRKSPREIRIMQQAGDLVARAHELIENMIAPGVPTELLDREVEKFVKSRGGKLLFKGYRGFPANICVSINEEVVHGIPSARKLQEGDIVSVDIGVEFHGYVGDAAKTYPVGKISPEASRLLEVCQQTLQKAIEAAQPKAKLVAISRAIQEYAESHGYSVVRRYTGHGVGRHMHEDPQVLNYVDRWAYNPTLKVGYCLAIEPMLNIGTHQTEEIVRQGWEVVVTRDRKLSAHFEHSIAITEDGPLILTLPSS